MNVRILEIDGDRRRLSLSLKRVEEGEQPVPRADGAESVHETPNLVLSEEAFPASGAVAVAEAEAEAPETEADDEAEEVEAPSEPIEMPRQPPTRSTSLRSARSPKLWPRSKSSPKHSPSSSSLCARSESARADSDRATPRGGRSAAAAAPISHQAPSQFQPPVAVAITGGIGAGKSSALQSFRRHGAATVSSDEIVHHLLATDPEVKRALVERLGEEILGQDGAP